MSFYRIYLATGSNPTSFTKVKETPLTEVLLSELDLTVGRDYYAYVTAVSAAGVESAPSGTISFRY